MACTGNLRKLPKPTAFPAIASISPTREPHESTLLTYLCFMFQQNQYLINN
jgi:hypothetical protein